MNEFSDRLRKVYDYKGFSKYSEFAEITGLSHQVASNYIKGVKTPAIDKMKQIKLSFDDINGEWLLTGEGNMLKKELNILHDPKATEFKVDRQYIPLYGIEGTAGVVSLFQNPKAHQILDTISIPNMPVCDGAITVTGDSMYPIIKSGDIVIYKTIQDIPQSIFFGNTYIVSVNVEGDEMTVVKYVQRGKDENHILLVSENRHHADKEIHIKNINAMALVKANIRFNSLT